MSAKGFIILVVGFAMFTLCAQSFAGIVDWAARDRYLKEQEQAAQKPAQDPQLSQDLPQWMQVEPVVKADEEKKYDANKDGVFQPVETKVYLRRTYQEIQNGTAKNVSTSELLKQYDKNQDGIVSKLEAEKIKKDAF
ncbi:MAG: hypothetical protein WCX16_06770 [Candidatus Omnitrophota bacterium]